jgi:hypothetical protein
MIRTLGPATLLVAGCGAGVPLLHGAHPLDPGEVSVGAGISGQRVRGPVATRIRAGQDDDGEPETADATVGAVLLSTQAPSLAPWVSSRMGIGQRSDAGLTFTGREVRLDARRAWPLGAWAVSAGAGLGAVLSRQSHVAEDSEADRRVRANTQVGFGLDVPVLVGWQSSPDVVQAWTGVRGGYERLSGNLVYAPDDRGSASSSIDATARRWYVGPVLGLAVGVEPVWVAFELAAAYQSIRGDLRESPSGSANSPDQTPSPAASGSRRLGFTSTGYALVPSAAFVGRF